MDPIVAVFSIRIAIHKSPGAPDVEAPTAKAVEDACADAVTALVAGSLEASTEYSIDVNADATRTDE